MAGCVFPDKACTVGLFLAKVLLISIPLSSAICPKSEWVDPDTPAEVCDGGKDDISGTPLELVFSDEFNVDGRTFQDGHDPKWTAITGYPTSNEQSNAYVDLPEYANTANGKLRLLAASATSNMQYWNSTSSSITNLERGYATPMLQTWNKFCFTEGVLEMSARLPGEAKQGGLWPAFWLMGNIGRATAQASTDKVWPFSYSHCPSEADAAANQYIRDQQMINACRDVDWTNKYGLNPHQGRGAIELDIVEAMPGSFTFEYKLWKIDSGYCEPLAPEDYNLLVSPRPMVATSLQLGPGIPRKSDQRPLEVDLKWGGKQKYNCVPSNWSTQWYPELKQGNWSTYGTTYKSQPNVDFWGEYFLSTRGVSEALSDIDLQTDSLSSLNTLPFEAWEGQHVYSLDWKAGPDGWVYFTLDGKKQFRVNSSSATKPQNITYNGKSFGTLLGRQMPEEPSYMMLNIDLSSRWGWPDCQEEYCDCCADCRDPACTRCFYPWNPNVNTRQWLADLCETLPAYYEIDYVRLWQRPGNTRTSCSPTDYPTQGWIESQLDNYILPNMNEPLRPVFGGGGGCTKDADCGGSDNGLCVDEVCKCQGDWTGPKCLVHKAGSSAVCSVVEDAVLGGAACEVGDRSSCSAMRGHGECVLAARQSGVYSANQTLYITETSSWKMIGGGLGRCKCKHGWGGSACNIPRSTEHCLADDFPDVSWNGADLEAYIARICSNANRSNAGNPSLLQACHEVQWKPHWLPGGRYSVCGSWPRAVWIALAISCKDPSGLNYLLLGTFIGVFSIVLIVGCAALVWKSQRPVAKKQRPMNVIVDMETGSTGTDRSLDIGQRSVQGESNSVPSTTSD